MSEQREKQMEILIIEDDADIRAAVRILLEEEGYHVTEASCGEEGIKRVTESTNLIILDVMMPGKSGYETCEEIRRFSYVPILFLTAKSKENDKLLGFHAGGDDYLVKPFSFSELSARVKALLRRSNAYNAQLPSASVTEDWLSFEDLRVHSQINQVTIKGSIVNLTETEYEILLLLMQYPTRVFSIPDIYESIWKEPYRNSYSNSVMVHIRNLRAKIEPDPQSPKYILTVWGKGYRFGNV